MKRRNPNLEADLEALLAQHRRERKLSPEVRARAVARARSIISGAILAEPRRELDGPAPLSRVRRGVVARVALAGSVALAVGVIGHVVVSHGRVPSSGAPSLVKTASDPAARPGDSGRAARARGLRGALGPSP